MELTKDHKWLLASHLQKSIRRGWSDEAVWAGSNLHDIDRGYLAYRLSVIAVEDVGVGDVDLISSHIDFDNLWGARRFGYTKSNETKDAFIEVIKSFSSAVKDRTPCEWMSCAHWLKQFEEDIDQAWSDLSINEALEHSLNADKEWWWRGLMAWRAAGTDKYPSAVLPEVKGDWDMFVESSNTKLHKLLKGYGARQREAHPVFIPLSYEERIRSDKSKITNTNCGAITKSGVWINPALDKHTSEGKRAILDFMTNLPAKTRNEMQQVTNRDRYKIQEIIGSLMFWMEGCKTDKSWSYPLQDEMSLDIKKNWLKYQNISGRWLFDNFGKMDEWNKSRSNVIQKSYVHNKVKNNKLQ